MTFTIENEQMMIMELLETIEMELCIEFSPAEFKVIQQYIANNPNVDPNKILEEIFTIAQKKLNKKLDAEKIKRIQKQSENSKLFTERSKHAPRKSPQQNNKKLTDKEIKRIIDEAEKKLLDKKAIKNPLTDEQKDKAVDYFKQNSKENDSPVTKANVALLGVICVGIAGGVRPVVLQNWGNLLSIPDVNPYHGDSTLDQGNKIDFQLGDSMGIEFNAIKNVISVGIINPLFAVDGPNQKNSGQSSTSTSRLPSLKPPGGNPLDPFD